MKYRMRAIIKAFVNLAAVEDVRAVEVGGVYKKY
jgi:hypothetical protein